MKQNMTSVLGALSSILSTEKHEEWTVVNSCIPFPILSVASSNAKVKIQMEEEAIFLNLFFFFTDNYF